MGCPNDPSYRLVLYAEPLADSMILTEPVFVATITAWVDDPGPGCRPTPPNLATMFGQGVGGVWIYVQIGEPAIATGPGRWGTLESLYR